MEPLQKSHFKTGCYVEVLDNPGMFMLTEELIYYSAKLDKDIQVPAFYVTDFASIPWFFHSIIQVNGKHRKPAVLHDYLCTDGETIGISQRDADLIFYEAMESMDTRLTQRTIMFGMVRAYQFTKHSIKGLFK